MRGSELELGLCMPTRSPYQPRGGEWSACRVVPVSPHILYAVSCELGLKETTEPTGGTQQGEYWGGPTNGQAAACRRRLAAVELATPLHRKGGVSSWCRVFTELFRLVVVVSLRLSLATPLHQ